jgi:hypothetical protein
MQTDQEQDSGRREFLRQIGRWAVALTLGGGLWAVSSRRLACADDGLCNTCAIAGVCGSRERASGTDAPTRTEGGTERHE